MSFQADEKKLVAEYFNADFIPAEHIESNGVQASDFDLPYPIWFALRKAYYDKAVAWKIEQIHGASA